MSDSTTEFDVRGIASGDQARAVADELEAVDGVQMAVVDEDSGHVEVRYGEELLSE
jgi:copper chaperone CopZ